MRRVRTSPRVGRLTLRTTNLEDSVFQVQDVDVVVSRADNQTVVLSQRDHWSHDAGTRTEVSQTHELTRLLRTMELISGISRLDLKQDPVSGAGKQTAGAEERVSPVVWSLCPHGFDVLQKIPRMSQAVLPRSRCHGNAHLLDEFAPAPGADLSVSCAHKMRVGGQQAEDGTFVSCKTATS